MAPPIRPQVGDSEVSTVSGSIHRDRSVLSERVSMAVTL